ncbi:MAG TPA: YchF/TatD family DNA exonuclease [Ignavibacteriaceae bacterium]|nr:YchF/TatD family DNA exonuclease [Ignavibacteriaceae bacterium]
MFVDTHAHLFYQNFKGDLDTIIQRAKDAHVDYIIVPSTDFKTAKHTLDLCEKYDIVYGAVGIHPHDTKDWDNRFLGNIEEIAKHDKIIAVGEIGLDYYYDYSPKEDQIRAFKDQIELALKLNLPVIVHNREADEDILEIISSYCGTGLKAQFHCFGSSIENARKLIMQHHFLSFTGNITFKKSEELQNVLKKVSLEHLLLETDSPFMTPVPHRGMRNEPAYVKLIAQKIAEVHDMQLADIARVTSFNAFRMFGIGSLPKTSFTYKIGNALYINMTNRCNADCVFCRRKEEPFIKGYNLKMSKSEEPPVEVYIKEIGNPQQYSEIVFCGFGEPTLRWEEVKQIAAYVKKMNGKTRLDTNGHGNIINKRDITPEMKELFDTVSISLNTADQEQYAEIMGVEQNMFTEAINFAQKAKPNVSKVIMTLVSYDNIDIGRTKKFVEDIGAEFRLREYF